MEETFLELEDDNMSLTSLLKKFRSVPPEPSREENGFLMTEDKEDKNDPFASSENDKMELTKSDEEENASFELENGDNPLVSFLKKGESKPLESKREGHPNDQNSPFLSSFLIELVHGIKNTLVSISNNALRAIDKPEDVEFRKNSQTSIKEDIKKLDSVLNSLLNYININTPIIKSNTVNLALEGALEANEKQLQDKKIKVIKKCEKYLPETSVHEEQLRFILNSVLQYAILSTPVNGTIGFLTKSFDFQNATNDKNASPENSEGYIRVAIGFVSEKKPVEQLKSVSEIPAIQKEKTITLILQLVKEILQKNRGMMTVEVDEKKPRTFITLRFPIERRKVIYYEPVTI